MKDAKHFNLFPPHRRGATVLVGNAAIATKDLASAPAIMASAFGKLNLQRRARMLGRLLGSVGPLALAVVSGGAFAKYLRSARWPEVPITLEDAARATSKQVYDLVRYVEQSNPHLVDGLLTALLRDGVTMTALGASLVAVAIKHLSRRRDGRPGSSTRAG